MNIQDIICTMLLVFEIGALGYALTARRFSSKTNYAYARWLPIFMCIISFAFNAINYVAAKSELSMHTVDIVTSGVSLTFVVVALVMASFSVELTAGFMEVQSLFGRNRIDINASTTAVLQTRTRGSWWIVISNDGRSQKVSGVINDFRRLCSEIDGQMSHYGNQISVVDALGKRASFSDLRN
jgi:hypothetical protein